MAHPEDNRIKFHMRNICKDQQLNVVSFRSYPECSDDELRESYETIVGKILTGRDVIIVTKGALLMELLSDAVGTADQNYVAENALKISTFTLETASFETHATLLKKVPLSVAKDLATSSEFVFGNLFFLIHSSDVDFATCCMQVIDDTRKLAPSAFDEPPSLWHEAVASPAMYDGLEILWFKPDSYVLENVIRPLFGNQLLQQVCE